MSDASERSKSATGKFPSGIGLSGLDPTFREAPYPILDKLRREEPIHRDGHFDRVFVTRFDDARQVTSDTSNLVDPRKSREGSYARLTMNRGVGGRFERALTRLDDPDHGRLRSLVMKAFTPKSIGAVMPRISEITGRLIAEIGDKTSFDFIDEFAGPLPCLVIAEMLGVDQSEQKNFKMWSEARQYQNHPARTPEQDALLEWGQSNLSAYFKRVVDERRGRRGDDLVSVLINAEENGNKLTEEEIIDTCKLLLSAGNVTTTDLLGNGIVALLRNPDQLRKLRSEPGLIQNAVEEMLRFDSPVAQANRITSAPREMRGKKLEAGESITVSVLGANHDPAIHKEPARFDIERKDTRHLAFGGGLHFCLGSPLARAEAQLAIPLFLKHFPKLELSPDHELRRKESPAFNGWDHVWLTTA